MGDKIKQAKASRDIYLNRLKEIHNIAKAAEHDVNCHTSFKMRYLGIETSYKLFEKQHSTIVTLSATIDDADLAAEDLIRVEADDSYYGCLSIYHSLFENSKEDLLNDTSQVQSPAIKLPKIKLPVFDGDFRSWTTFYDLFTSIVDNNHNLSNSEKFQYLLSSLSEKILPIVSSIPINDNNYPIAFKALVDRFQNKRLLATHYWNAICNLEKLTSDSSHLLRNVIDTFCENLQALTNLQFPTDQWDFVLFNLLIQKLDQETLKRFELEYSCIEMPTFQLLKDFLLKQCIAYDSVALSTLPKVNSPKRQLKHTKPQYSFVVETDVCLICQSSHPISRCSEFLNKTPNDRYHLAKQHKLCLNCLKSSHIFSDCTSTYSCKKCKQRHHTLLHFNRNNNLQNRPPPKQGNRVVDNDSSSVNALSIFASLKQPSTTVLLSTARVEVLDHSGCVFEVRVLLDSASQANFMTEKCLRRLNLFLNKSNVSVQGLGRMPTTVLGSTCCSIRPNGQSNPTLIADCFVIPKICGSIPSFHFKPNSLSHISGLNLADKSFNSPGEIDILLGADIFSKCIQSGRVQGSENNPVALETIFGWVLMGNVEYLNSASPVTSLCTTLSDPLDTIIKSFWEIEESPSIKPLSLEEQQCEQFFVETHSRDKFGRYCVSLPFKGPEPVFSDSRSLALRRYLNLERRLVSNPTLYRTYSEFMSDYLARGHMSPVTDLGATQQCYYMPHHAVFKPESSTTKLRVVFDASAKTPTGESLNDTLMVGPKLQKDIVSILLNFRRHKIVLISDIKQMYRQILVKTEHCNYQRILWRFSVNEPIRDFALKTVTFGVTSSPFLALRTVYQLACDEGDSFPLASRVLKSDIFVDDVVTSCDSIEEAVSLASELQELCSRGGFELRKWASNDPQVLSHLPESLCQTKSISFDSEPESVIKILGLQWHPSLDAFSYKVDPLDRPCTKRNILSELARVYDPLGFLSPSTFFTKHLIQHLWTLGLDWDAVPPEEVLIKWIKYKTELPRLTSISVPRFMMDKTNKTLQLHGFSDASEKGYAAVVYVRLISVNDEIRTHLVMAKSKVAPLKRVTLPRLELCGALLVSKLLYYVSKIFQDMPLEIFAWSDSMVTLSWIKSSSHRWQCFVSNRVSQIHENTSPAKWYYVASQDNPADCASRGLMPLDLVNHNLWWMGPSWLVYPQKCWPNQSNEVDTSLVLKEEKRVSFVIDVSLEFPIYLIDKYSSLCKIKRIIAYLLRFVENCRHPSEKRITIFDDVELYQALVFLVKHVQYNVFSNEIHSIKNEKYLPKTFRKLSPFLDKDGVLRVGGRLSNSDLTFDQKFPILLPRKHRLTDLIIENFHKQHFHPGLQSLQFLISQQFWILSPKRAIRSVISKCVTCFKVKPKPMEHPMGDLPATRISQVKPFSFSGVDMAGPFYITMSRRRGSKSQKAYLCLFVCFSTKAVHLEVTSDLSSESFLAALRRFVARRGRCSRLFSDCGTNFIGANRELLKFMQTAAELEHISWSFNPPASPHMGGLWEAAVKSVKTHFIRVVGEQILTYEELSTVFVQIESMLNSRPLCSLSSDPSDLSVLTPGHFLTLEPLTAVPSPDLTNLQTNRLNRWQLLQKITQDFWKRWQIEYLHSLQQKSKWNKPVSSIELDTLVLIKNECSPPLQWRLGRVVKLHKGRDGICRVCTVKTSQGLLQRPVVKLCPLPTN